MYNDLKKVLTQREPWISEYTWPALQSELVMLATSLASFGLFGPSGLLGSLVGLIAVLTWSIINDS